MTTRQFLYGIEKHFLPRVNAREVKIKRGKDAKLCIIFSSAYFHSVLLPLSLLPSNSFFACSSFLAMLSDRIRRHNHGRVSGILRQIQTFLKVIFFNQRLLKDSYLDLVRAFLESIFLSPSSIFPHRWLIHSHPFHLPLSGE